MRKPDRITVVLSPEIKRALKADAERSTIGVSGIARQILVDHYRSKGEIE